MQQGGITAPLGGLQAEHTLVDIETVGNETTPTEIRSLLELQPPTAYELLAALPKQKRPKKYPLEQISAPTTGLSHQLGWTRHSMG